MQPWLTTESTFFDEKHRDTGDRFGTLGRRCAALLAIAALAGCESGRTVAPATESAEVRPVPGTAATLDLSASPGDIVIDDFTGGAVSYVTCSSNYKVQSGGTIMGTYRETYAREAGPCTGGNAPRVTVNPTAGTLNFGGISPYSAEHAVRYGSRIGASFTSFPQGTPNPAYASQLNLNLKLTDKIKITVSNVVSAGLSVRLYAGNGGAYSYSFAPVVGENLIPLSVFGMSAATAQDIDGIEIASYGNKDPGTTIKLIAIKGSVSVFTSDATVDTWDPIIPAQAYANWETTVCTLQPMVGPNANWTNPHKAFVLGGHPWANSYFTAPWINAWSDLGSRGPGGHSWTKYRTQVSGTGSFVVSLLADNCSWIYLDGTLVGVQGTDLSKNSYGLTLNGDHTLEFIIFDGGGAAGGKFRLETTTNPPPPLVLDNTPPVITPTVTGTQGDNGWYTSDVGISWSVTDGESTVSSQNGCTASSVVNDGDNQTFTCTATSGGGTSSQSVTIKRDATKPTVSGSIAGDLGNNGWYVSDATVTWTSSDAMSGIVTNCAPVTRSTDTPGQQYDCTVSDKAGNTASASVSLKRDATKPTAVANVSGTMGNGGWYVGDVTVSFATADATSGVAGSTSCSTTVRSTDTPGTTYSCTVTDAAGNSNSASTSIKRDATKPTIGYTPSSASYTVDQTVSIMCAASDALSGLASSTCANVSGAAYTFDLGQNTRSASAADVAGNTNSASVTFTVSVTNGSLCALVRRFVSNNGVANSMCVKLDKSNYEPFINEVEAQSGKQFLSGANADILIRLAKALR